MIEHRGSTWIALAGCVAVISRAGIATAAPTEADKALATQLFKDGRALLEQKHFAEACPKLEESQRLDPGGGTLLNLAICHRGEGRLATAWTELTEALGIARRDGRADRVALAEKQIAEIDPQVPRLTIVVPSEADLPGLEVSRDGSLVGRAAWGQLIPLDPGDHVVEARAPGHSTWQQTIGVGVGDRPSLTVPVLGGLESAAPIVEEPRVLVPVVTIPAPPVAPRTSVAEEPPHGLPPLRVVAFVAFGAGGAAFVAAAVTGGLAIVKRRDSDALCTPLCTAEAYDLNEQAKPFADAATATVVLGVVGVATGGITLGLSLPRGSSRPPATTFHWTGTGGALVHTF